VEHTLIILVIFSWCEYYWEWGYSIFSTCP